MMHYRFFYVGDLIATLEVCAAELLRFCRGAIATGAQDLGFSVWENVRLVTEN